MVIDFSDNPRPWKVVREGDNFGYFFNIVDVNDYEIFGCSEWYDMSEKTANAIVEIVNSYQDGS